MKKCSEKSVGKKKIFEKMRDCFHPWNVFRLRGSIVVTFEMMRCLDVLIVVFFGIVKLGLDQSVGSQIFVELKWVLWLIFHGLVRLNFIWVLHLDMADHSALRKTKTSSQEYAADVLRALIKGELTGKERPGSRGRQPVSRKFSQSAVAIIQSAEFQPVSRGCQPVNRSFIQSAEFQPVSSSHYPVSRGRQPISRSFIQSAEFSSSQQKSSTSQL